MSYFPMYTDLSNKKCIVYGGGRIAYRKVKVLLDFGAAVTVIAQKIMQEIRDMNEVDCIEAAFSVSWLCEAQPFLVIAATSDSLVNTKISLECQKRRIPVNVVDSPKECTFIFPAYIKKGEVVGAFSSGGKSPIVAQYLKKEMEKILTEEIGEIADHLGEMREEVKESLKTEAEKKKFYQEMFQQLMEEYMSDK